MEKKYQLPDLHSEEGNAFAIMSYVRKALEENKKKHLVKGYLERATSSNYANLIGESYIMLDELNRKIEKENNKNK